MSAEQTMHAQNAALAGDACSPGRACRPTGGRQYHTVAGYPDYVICDQYPFEIRKRIGWYRLKEYVQNGYIMIKLNGHNVRKHRLIATQFIPNPDELPQVDHIDGDRSNYRLDNLRWCSNMQNCNNKLNDETVPELPDEAIVVDSYGDWEFEDLYYCDNIFYKYNGIDYKIISTLRKPCGTYLIKARDTNSIQRCIYYPKFKRDYGLI